MSQSISESIIINRKWKNVSTVKGLLLYNSLYTRNEAFLENLNPVESLAIILWGTIHLHSSQVCHILPEESLIDIFSSAIKIPFLYVRFSLNKPASMYWSQNWELFAMLRYNFKAGHTLRGLWGGLTDKNAKNVLQFLSISAHDQIQSKWIS